MKKILLPYGQTKLELNLPEERIAGILESHAHEFKAEKSESELVRDALENPVDSPRLKDLVVGKKNIVLIASDHTRPVPSKVILPEIMKEIEAGNPDATLTILIATGFHRLTTRDELISKFGEEMVDHPKIKYVVHDSGNEDELTYVGLLPSGGKLIVNKLAVEADLLISEGFIEPHFFAGFSGGRKSVLPGVCSRTTVLANHCSKFIADPNSRAGSLDDNLMHKDMLWAAEAVNLQFICNVLLDADKKVIAAYAGHLNNAHRKGCAFMNELAGVKAIPSDIAITTNGGAPLDQNIYQSVKGMTAAEATCNPGGVIIMASSCNDGHGGESFYRVFADEPDNQKIMDQFLATPQEETIPDQWESQILCRLLLKFKIIMVTDAPEQMIRDMHMDYAHSLDEAIAMADEYLGKKDSKITVIPDGIAVIVNPAD
ncbi:nickel-dependent lactate racemase [Frisingicoccus sp.]|uniref:nickel-dependent lactate racemase n=1 Tax=Frisingicoccus sp. TaxID=1918627 RepID=UPI002EA82C61|nr:nickel-dependent lactate racemase [Frisingicoccus sp.]